MPRFLNTWTGEFEWHNDPKKVRYAILSHVWRTPEEGGEQSYNDVCRIQAAERAVRKRRFRFRSRTVHWPQFPHRDDTSPSDTLYASFLDGISVIFSAGSPLSNKIKSLCKVARDAGFRLVWDDTCCIDKSSSAELSEAINSMYEWYRLSDMCYVYLADVRDGSIFDFANSNWHKRGWTLQELIAPEHVEFLTCSWTKLGTKLGLAFTLARTTEIDVDILLGRAPVQSASVAQRMSWAAKRETTRVEDQAYSLMGLFGVHMSPIYGEGTNAFLRLQEEVIRTIPDQSIFAWHLSSGAYIRSCLLASVPESFRYSTARPITPSEFASRLNLRGLEEVPPLDCTFAPQGARIRLLCVDLTEVRQRIPSFLQYDIPQWCVDNRSLHGEGNRLALLRCEDADGRLIGLPFLSSDVAGSGRCSPVGYRCDCRGGRFFRIMRLSRKALAKILEVVTPETAEVFLLRHRSVTPPSKSLLPRKSLTPLRLWPGDRPDGPSFSLSPDSVANLRRLGFTVTPLQITREKGEITLETTLAWRDGDLLHSIPLRLSLEALEQYTWRWYVRICFEFTSAAPLSSPGLVGGSTATSCTATNLVEVLDSDSGQIKEAPVYGVERQYTLAQFDFRILPYPDRPLQEAQLVRLSLERPSQDRLSARMHSSRTVFLVIEISEEHQYIAESRSAQNNQGDATLEDADSPSKHDGTSELNGDSAQPSSLIVPGVLHGSQSPGANTTQCAPLEERVDALGRENSALREQVSTATSHHPEMESKIAALAGQNAALASENAALRAQMTAVWQRLDRLTAAAATATSSLPARVDAT